MELIKNKISVVVPIYNMEKYLNRSLDSLLAQTYEDIEVVAVNDGSTDDSLEILKYYSQRDSRIKIIDKPNGGLVDAVYTGVVNSIGEYICFVDPDDYVSPAFVDFFMKCFDRDDEVDAVAGEIISVDKENLETIISLEKDAIYDSKEIKDNFFWDLEQGRMKNIIFHSRCNKAYRTECLLKFIDEYHMSSDSSVGEDTIFTYLFLNFSRKVKVCCTTCGYYYVNNHDSMMHNDFRKLLHNSMITFKNLLNLSKKYGGNDKQAYFYYYIECNYARFLSLENSRDAIECLKVLRHDKDYQKAIKYVSEGFIGNQRIKYLLKMKLKQTMLYLAYKRIRKSNHS